MLVILKIMTNFAVCFSGKHFKITRKNNNNMKKSVSLRYSSKFINSNFRLKVAGVDALGNRINKLVGVAGLIALIGVEMLNKLLDRALRCVEDVCVCKLRRGLKVSFYAK